MTITKLYNKYQLLVLFFCFIIYSSQTFAQPTAAPDSKVFTHADSLRGTITPERAWWDVTCYKIAVNPDYDKKYIEGKTEIQFKALKEGKRMQIDLQQPMEISRVYRNKDESIPFIREGNVYYLDFPQAVAAGTLETIVIVYHGNPRVAIRPPWDGGWIFTKDKMGRPWMSVACQGLGASVWYPCKDHQSDEPDSAFINIAIPDTLVGVANGRFLGKESFSPGMMTYRWAVKNPINNYNIIPYIGKYVSWNETFNGEKGKLDCEYWVLDYELDKAKEQFKQVPLMLKCFEHWFGPYPWYEDGYKLVQAPHLGMEHQSAVAYGNRFANGYLGRDLSQTGWGLKWDFIIVHESGHEWFGNNITSNDIADMWVHEGFTNYSETIFTTCEYGVEAGNDYVIGTRKNIRNDKPIIGTYGVNEEGSGDMYYKGGNMLHTIRQLVKDDEKFRSILRGLNQEFYHKTVTTKQIEDYISQKAGMDLSKVFDEYLRTTMIPRLEYAIQGGKLKVKWSNVVKGFAMPVKIKTGDSTWEWIKPTTSISKVKLKNPITKFEVDRNFYIDVSEMKQ